MLYNKEASSTRIYGNLVRHVPQEDALEPALTVVQNMQLAAHLSLPPHFTPHRRDTLVQEVLELLALHPLQHCLVGTPGAAGQQATPYFFFSLSSLCARFFMKTKKKLQEQVHELCKTKKVHLFSFSILF